MSGEIPAHFDVTFTFPAEGYSSTGGAHENPIDLPTASDFNGSCNSSSSFAVVQARAGGLTPRSASQSDAIMGRVSPAPPQQSPFRRSTSATKSAVARLQSLHNNTVGHPPGAGPAHKPPSHALLGALDVSGSSMSGSPRTSPAMRSLVAYVHGASVATDGTAEDVAASDAGGTAAAEEDAVAQFWRSSRSRGSIHSYTRQRLSSGKVSGGGSRRSTLGTPQLMYRQETVEEVARMSPVASAANSTCNTPELRSRHTSDAGHTHVFTAAAGASAAFEQGERPATTDHEAMRGAASPACVALGVSTPEMAEYFNDTAVYTGATYPAEKIVNGTFVMQKCLRRMEEQARMIQVLQSQVQILRSRNNSLEDRVLQLEMHQSGPGTGAAAAAAAQVLPSAAAGGGGSEESELQPGGRGGSGSPSVTRPSDTLSDEHCSTRAPSKAV